MEYSLDFVYLGFLVRFCFLFFLSLRNKAKIMNVLVLILLLVETLTMKDDDGGESLDRDNALVVNVHQLVNKYPINDVPVYTHFKLKQFQYNSIIQGTEKSTEEK